MKEEFNRLEKPNIAEENKVDVPAQYTVHQVQTENSQQEIKSLDMQIIQQKNKIVEDTAQIEAIRRSLGLEGETEIPSIEPRKEKIVFLEKEKAKLEISSEGDNLEPFDGEGPEQFASRFFNALHKDAMGNISKEDFQIIRFKKDKAIADGSGRWYSKMFEGFVNDDEKRKKFLEALKKTVSVGDVRQGNVEDIRQLSILEKMVGGSSRDSFEADHQSKTNHQDYYNNTNTERDFLNRSSWRPDADSYAYMMFGLPTVFANTPEGHEYLRNFVDGKRIFLFGGGDSVKDLLLSKEFHPSSVVNFDPYLKYETANKNLRGMYRSEGMSATDPAIREMAENGDLQKADEIWASYSVPYYLNTSQEIENLIDNIVSALADGGNARICPVSVQTKEGEDNFESRKKALLDAVEKITHRDDINITVFGATLKIHKVKKS